MVRVLDLKMLAHRRIEQRVAGDFDDNIGNLEQVYLATLPNKAMAGAEIASHGTLCQRTRQRKGLGGKDLLTSLDDSATMTFSCFRHL